VSERRFFTLAHRVARERAMEAVREAQEGMVVEIRAPSRSGDQNAKFHAMFTDISRQCEFMGHKWKPDDWKRLLVDLFAKTMRNLGTPLHHDGRVIPSLDGTGVVQLGIQTKQFWKKEASDFIEFLYAYGAENGVIWSDAKTASEYEEWRARRAA